MGRQRVDAGAVVDTIATHIASCQAPWPMALTPGMMRGVTFASIRTSPRLLKTRTVSPFLMPRFSASTGLSHTSWRQAAFSTSTLP